MIPIAYDFHIHSCLSPCANDDMTPANIIGMAFLKGLNAIAVTDHNSSLHCKATMEIGERYGIIVMPGMELSTKEEVHVICLFETLEGALLFETHVRKKLFKLKNEPRIFGRQILMGEEDNKIGEVDDLLIQATDIPFSDVYNLTRKNGGIMIPAHIDKKANSLLSNLGFVPLYSKFSCVEMKDISQKKQLFEQHIYLQECLCITNSDAHKLEDISEAINYLSVTKINRKEILKQLSL